MATNSMIPIGEAHMEMLDHVGEHVHVGIMLPGDVPWAGTYGTLSHQAQRLRDDLGDADSGLLLQHGIGVGEGLFMVGEFVIPLNSQRVRHVRPKYSEGTALYSAHPGLDFTIEPGELTVRVTFAEHVRES